MGHVRHVDINELLKILDHQFGLQGDTVGGAMLVKITEIYSISSHIHCGDIAARTQTLKL